MSFGVYGSILVGLLIISTITDLKKRIIPNVLTYPTVLLFSILRMIEGETSFFLGVIPAGIFFVLYLINPSFIGAGDIKLLAVVGLAIGFNATFGVMFWMCLIFLLVVLGRKLMHRKAHSLPLAPFIFIGYIIVFILEV